MLKIRLKRVGRKHDATFRVVVVESSRGPKSGDYIENVGVYDPRQDSKNINADRVKHWLEVGALPSDTVHNLLVEIGVITGKKVNVLPKKSPQGGSEEKEETVTESTNEEAEKSPAEEPSTEEEPKAETSEESSSAEAANNEETKNVEENTESETSSTEELPTESKGSEEGDEEDEEKKVA